MGCGHWRVTGRKIGGGVSGGTRVDWTVPGRALRRCWGRRPRGGPCRGRGREPGPATGTGGSRPRGAAPPAAAVGNTCFPPPPGAGRRGKPRAGPRPGNGALGGKPTGFRVAAETAVKLNAARCKGRKRRNGPLLSCRGPGEPSRAGHPAGTGVVPVAVVERYRAGREGRAVPRHREGPPRWFIYFDCSRGRQPRRSRPSVAVTVPVPRPLIRPPRGTRVGGCVCPFAPQSGPTKGVTEPHIRGQGRPDPNPPGCRILEGGEKKKVKMNTWRKKKKKKGGQNKGVTE